MGSCSRPAGQPVVADIEEAQKEKDEWAWDWHTELAAQYKTADTAVQDEASSRQHVPVREQH